MGSHDEHHDQVVNNLGSVSWPHAFSIQRDEHKRCLHPSWSFNRRLRTSRKPMERFFRNVFHVVRHPLASVASRWGLGHIKAFMSVSRCQTTAGMKIPKDQRWYIASLQETLQHWVLWNSFIDHVASWTFKLEDTDANVFVNILNRSGVH